MSEFSETRQYYLDLMRYNAEAALVFVHGMDEATYQDDLKTQFATERAIQNLSEAARDLERGLRPHDPDFDIASISGSVDWRAVKGIGDILRHDYDTIRSDKIWRVTQEFLPGVVEACRESLEEHSAFYEDDGREPDIEPEL